MKSLARLVLVCAALLLVSSLAFGQVITTPRLTTAAARQLDSLASASRETRRETAACVEFTTRGEWVTIERLTPANVAVSDSLTVIPPAGATLCPAGVPDVHTHVAHNGSSEPSPHDLRARAQLPLPFLALLVVRDNGWFVVLY